MFSRTTDRRGQIVESLIDEEQLILINRNNALYTFSGPRGENNNDITLAFRDISDMINGWDIKEGVITSDHRLIEFNIGKGSRPSKIISK